jgi:hypothetical protein
MAWTRSVLIMLSVLWLSTTLAQKSSSKNKSRDGKKVSKVAKVPYMDYPDGSGDGDIFEDRDDNFDASGDSGTVISACYQQQMKARERHMLDAYLPQCTHAGEFSPQQCHSAVHQCWCVYSNGREIPGTRRPETQRQHCYPQRDPEVPKLPPTPVRPNNSPARSQGTSGSKPDDDILVDPKDLEPSKNKPTQVSGASVDIAVANPDMNDLDIKGSSLESKSTAPSILSRPGFLAAIIGTTVVGLLLAVIIVMFVVYRMRKKDEGSYALDEPKASPTIGYTKTHDREFFA